MFSCNTSIFSVYSYSWLFYQQVICDGDLQEMDPLSERIFSLAFDVISNVLETGPVSSTSHFLSSRFISLLL